MKVHIRAYGEHGYLISSPELAINAVRCHVDQELSVQPLGNGVEHIWGAANLLLIFPSRGAPSPVREWFRAIEVDSHESFPGSELHEIPVRYDGPDLGLLAKQTGFDVDELITIHADPVYAVRMIGFSPGFPYLDGLDERLQVERRAQPRKRIAAGSVAIGGPHTGVYSVPSPGGWHILGHTDIELFRPQAAIGDDPILSEVFAFKPGDRIRFAPV